MTDDFVRYAKPLLGSDMISLPTIDGRQRMTRFEPIYAEQKLPKYVPQADRKVNMIDFTPKHDYLVGIDSDGCAFDTMELKHKECFIPNIINYWGLQGVSKYAREAAEFVNLYSKSRGINRFPALVEALEWTNKRPEVKARGIKVDIPQSLLRLDEARDEARQSGLGEGGAEDGRSAT